MAQNVGLVIGKFQPFHEGHEYLLKFADNYMEALGGGLNVVVCATSEDVISGSKRYNAVKSYIRSQSDDFRGQYKSFSKTVVHLLEKDLPQLPKDDVNFWDIWKKELNAFLPETKNLYVFASEMYGEQLAEVMGGTFIPCDLGRNIFPTSGTEILRKTDTNWNKININMRRFLKTEVVFIGAESTGKTTLAKKMSKKIPNSTFVPEYARGLLENIKNNDLNEENWEKIIIGGSVQETTVWESVSKRIFFYDTNMITTYGWLKLLNPTLFKKYKSDIMSYISSTGKNKLVFLTSDNGPFTPDPLRYGVTERQTDTAYWEEILKEVGIRFIKLETNEPKEVVKHLIEKGVIWNGK